MVSEMAPDPTTSAPLLDQETLDDLEDQVGSREIAVTFARDFTDMWSERFERLCAALEAKDAASAHDAILSLKITSAMLGAFRLVNLAAELEHAVNQSDLDRAAQGLPAIRACGNASVSQLLSTYILPDENS